jgi:AraC-like DNA-binding protein
MQHNTQEIYDTKAGPPRGVLRPAPAQGRLHHSRRTPPEDLEPWIQHYWSVGWNLQGCEPFQQETLPHPNVHIVFEPGRSGIAGVHTARFSRTLEGRSNVFGIKFRAGAFRPLLGSSVSTLANRVAPIDKAFGEAGRQWQAAMLSLDDEDARIAAASNFLRARMPAHDPDAVRAGQFVDIILQSSTSESGIRTVDELVRHSGVNTRSLQRLFREYVGASPKWVIRRYRLHELAERLKAGEALDAAQTALELGYSDQAHLINDFRSIVGYSPNHYRRQLRNPAR